MEKQVGSVKLVYNIIYLVLVREIVACLLMRMTRVEGKFNDVKEDRKICCDFCPQVIERRGI